MPPPIGSSWITAQTAKKIMQAVTLAKKGKAVYENAQAYSNTANGKKRIESIHNNLGRATAHQQEYGSGLVRRKSRKARRRRKPRKTRKSFW